MENNEWNLKSNTSTEMVYEIKDQSSTTEILKECTADENRRINNRCQVMKFTPMAGFYQIKDVHLQKKYKSDTDEYAARYSFTDNLDKKYVDFGMSLKLQPLFNGASEGINNGKVRFKNNPADLTNQVVHIQSWELVESTYEGKPTKVNKVKWLIVNDDLISGTHPTANVTLEHEDLGNLYIPEDHNDDDVIDSFDNDQEDKFLQEDIEPEDIFCPEDFEPEEIYCPEDFEAEDVEFVEVN